MVAGERLRGCRASLTTRGTAGWSESETRALAFDPFFTTKATGKGTGLGLATVYGVVQQSAGFIWVYSEPGRGTTFKIYLPRVDRPLSVGRRDTEKVGARGAGETILVVEDDAMVRRLARRVLERADYRVLEAASGGDAMILAEKTDAPILLLLTDVVLPQMSGPELAERLKAKRPALKVLFVSGHADGTLAYHGVLDPGAELLEKPFSAQELGARVHAVLALPRFRGR